MAARLVSRSAVALGTALDAADPRGWPAWVVGVLLVAVPSHALAAWRVLGGLPAGTRPPLRDSVIFQYLGWYLTQGGRLYVDLWELKPPLPYELTAVVSLLAGGDPLIAHWLNVLLTSAAAVGVALAAGLLVVDLTGDDAAAIAAGAMLYVVPAYHWRAAFGFKVKYFVALFALLAVYLARQDRPGAAGALAGAAAGFWQLAITVPAIVVGLAYERAGRRGVRRVATGALSVLVVGVLPVAYWGALEAMVTETLLVPLLLVGRGLSAASPVRLAVASLGAATPVVLLGALGVAVAAWRRPRETWWLAAGAGWFAVQAFLIDLDGPPDLFPLLGFLAVGLGLLVGFESGRQRPAALLVAALAVTSVLTLGGFGVGTGPLYSPEPTVYAESVELVEPYGPAERDLLYWRAVEPTTCRVFYGPTQHQLVQLTAKGPLQGTCGDAGPVLDALAERWLGG